MFKEKLFRYLKKEGKTNNISWSPASLALLEGVYELGIKTGKEILDVPNKTHKEEVRQSEVRVNFSDK